MALVHMLYFCAAKHNIHVIITHVAGVNNVIADAISCFQVNLFQQLVPNTRHHPCMASPVLEDSSATIKL